MKQEFKMSRTRFDELEKELNFLKTTRSDEVAEMIKVARGFGDLSENSEYDEAKNEQGKLYSRISELENILLHAVILEEGDMPTGQYHRLHGHGHSHPGGRQPELQDCGQSGGGRDARHHQRGLPLRQGAHGPQGGGYGGGQRARRGPGVPRGQD